MESTAKNKVVVATKDDGKTEIVFTGHDGNGLPRGTIFSKDQNGKKIIVAKDVNLYTLLSHGQTADEWGINYSPEQLQDISKKQTA